MTYDVRAVSPSASAPVNQAVHNTRIGTTIRPAVSNIRHTISERRNICFTIMLLAAATRTMKQMFLLSLIVCGAYGLLLYFDSVRAGGISEGALIRVPLLLIMAIFYGVTTETVRRAGQ